MRVALAVLLTLGAVSASAAELPPSTPIRGILIDDARGVVYASGVSGGVEAIDLRSGLVVWRSDRADAPLAIRENVLLAQVEDHWYGGPSLRLAFLDLEKQGRYRGEAVVELPSGARSLVGDFMLTTFTVNAVPEPTGFWVSWKYVEKFIDGISNNPEPPPIVFSGAAVVRLPETKPGGRRGAVAHELCPPGIAEQLKQTENLKHVPWRVGDVLAAVTSEGWDPVVVRRWDACTGQPIGDRLISSAQVMGWLPSMDARHLLVSERPQADGQKEYRWLIVALDTAEVVSARRYEFSALPFFVWRDRLVHQAVHVEYRNSLGQWIIVPHRLAAVDTATGAPVWERTIRDLRYNGPFPP